MNIKQGDSVVVRKLYVHPVPTNEEVRLLLDLFENMVPEKLALLMMIAEGPRPVELCRMTWDKFWFDDEKNQVTKFRHYVYKAGSRIVQKSTRFFLKEVEKPIFGKALSDFLMIYRKSWAPVTGARIFPWNTPGPVQKRFSQFRKSVRQGKLGKEYNFLLDKPAEAIVGPDSFTQYRVSMYSLRRFSLTFHYWITFDQDVLKLAEFTGHANPDTLMEHYVKPYHAIGLTPDMIKKKITIDQFINHRGKSQIPLSSFTEDLLPKFLPLGQRTISDFLA